MTQQTWLYAYQLRFGHRYWDRKICTSHPVEVLGHNSTKDGWVLIEVARPGLPDKHVFYLEAEKLQLA